MENPDCVVAWADMPSAARILPHSTTISQPSLDLLIDQALGNRVFPGIASGVWIDGHAEFIRYAGATESEAITGETLFDAASLTKPLATTLLVLKAHEAGSVDIDRTVGHYLPDINSRTAEIPVHALLTHTSGLPAIPALERRFPSSHSLARTTAIAELLAIQPERTHGEHVCYSCTGYMLLGLILEKVSGMLLGDLYRREIAGPLRLPRATFAPGIDPAGEPLAIANAAATEICGWRKRRIRGQVHDESAYCLGGHSGNAGLFVSLEDVFITASVVLQGGSANGTRFLTEKSVSDMTTEKTKNLEERRSFGFRLHDSGTFEGPLWRSTSFGHTGFTGTSLAFSPEHRLVSVILANRVYYGRNETAQKMIDFRTAFHSQVYRNFCI